MTLVLPPRGVQVLLLTLVVGAAVYDIRYRRIPNWLTAGGVLAGIALNTFLWMDQVADKGWAGLFFSLKGLALGFGIYFVLYLLRAMGAGDVKLMAAVGAMVGAQDWFGIFVITAIIGGVMALLLAASRGRMKSTLWNVGFILSEMKSGRPAYVGKEELDVKNPKALGLPHGFVIAVGTILFVAASYYFTK